MLDQICVFFDQRGWKYQRDFDLNVIHLPFSGDNGQWVHIVSHNPEYRLTLGYSLLPSEVPEDRRVAVAELLAAINYGMMLGCFEIDTNDGEVRYRTSLLHESDLLCDKTFEHMLIVNFSATDRYLPAILAVAHDGTPPAEALAALETPSKTTAN